MIPEANIIFLAGGIMTSAFQKEKLCQKLAQDIVRNFPALIPTNATDPVLRACIDRELKRLRGIGITKNNNMRSAMVRKRVAAKRAQQRTNTRAQKVLRIATKKRMEQNRRGRPVFIPM